MMLVIRYCALLVLQASVLLCADTLFRFAGAAIGRLCEKCAPTTATLPLFARFSDALLFSSRQARQH